MIIYNNVFDFRQTQFHALNKLLLITYSINIKATTIMIHTKFTDHCTVSMGERVVLII